MLSGACSVALFTAIFLKCNLSVNRSKCAGSVDLKTLTAEGSVGSSHKPKRVTSVVQFVQAVGVLYGKSPTAIFLQLQLCLTIVK